MYAAQIRVGSTSPWCTLRVVESPGVALALAGAFAKSWLGAAESQFEPMPDANWVFEQSRHKAVARHIAHSSNATRVAIIAARNTNATKAA